MYRYPHEFWTIVLETAKSSKKKEAGGFLFRAAVPVEWNAWPVLLSTSCLLLLLYLAFEMLPVYKFISRAGFVYLLIQSYISISSCKTSRTTYYKV
jgi:hypothetical protein